VEEKISAEEPKIAYIFPGQGSQWVGMGHELYQGFPRAREVFEEADSVLDFSLSRLCFEGPETELQQTINAQPAILTVSAAYLRVLPELFGEDAFSPPVFMAGHSLGEYSALLAADVLNFADMVRVVRERGRLMQQVGEKTGGGMVAIIGLEEAPVKEICWETGTQISNINCPGQIVVSGTRQALIKAIDLARAKGAHRTIPLQVSGAFHTSMMQPAADEMSAFISGFIFRDPAIPVIANTTARPVAAADEVRAELISQFCHCVYWQRSVENMIMAGVNTFIEIGPGRVLTGLIRRISKEAQTRNIGCMPVT
jgi:[acyl-carrier-protein] S-malonyltransferase